MAGNSEFLQDGHLYFKRAWQRYGLSVNRFNSNETGIRKHDLVAAYLDAHPDVAAKYTPDQGGEVKYFDVLKLAEAADKGGAE